MPKLYTPATTYEMPDHLFLTIKQHALMSVICSRNTDGTPVDLDQLLERLPYETTKESLQFSLKALVARGMIVKLDKEKRRGRCRRLIEATPLATTFMSAGVTPPASISFIESEAETAVFDALKALHSEGFSDLGK